MPRPTLGFILPATTQGELSTGEGSTKSTTGSADEVAEMCRRAEATGADSLWAVDHLYWPSPVGEAFTTLAVAAFATTRPMLGTCVLQLPLRPSSVVAKQATALQLLSGGRFILGLGVGIHEPEYRRAGIDYRRRGQLMDEGVAGLRQAWAGPDAGSADDYVQEPASAPVPLWFGGSSDAARKRAAAVGDGWVPLFLSPEQYVPALAALRRETAEAGRDPEAVQAVSSSLPASGTTSGRRSKVLNGSRISTDSRPRRSSGTWSPDHPMPVPPPWTATRKPEPGTSS